MQVFYCYNVFTASYLLFLPRLLLSINCTAGFSKLQYRASKNKRQDNARASVFLRMHNFFPIRYLHKAHCDLRVSRSQAKIDEKFANYLLKTKAKNKCFIVLKCMWKGLQKSISELEQ